MQLILSYAGKQGAQLTSKMKKLLKKVLLPDHVKTMVTYQSKKLASKFPVKDKIDFQHQNVVYYGKCPNPNCKDDRISETDWRVIERVINHNKQGKKSHDKTLTW